MIGEQGTNNKGEIGFNMPNNLQMEHTIKSTKNLTTSMGAKSSMAVTGVSDSLHAYNESSNVKPP